MSTFKIVPETDSQKNTISIIPKTDIKKCRRLCNDTKDCIAFVWKQKDGKELFLLKSKVDDTVYNKNSTLYIKNGNPSYWLLWTFLVILGVILFVIFCKR